MTPAPIDVYLRDEQNFRVLRAVDDWDQITFFGTASISPRTFEEFEWAWKNYRPDELLLERDWVDCGAAPPSSDEDWILFDLNRQRILASRFELLPANHEAYEPGQPRYRNDLDDDDLDDIDLDESNDSDDTSIAASDPTNRFHDGDESNVGEVDGSLTNAQDNSTDDEFDDPFGVEFDNEYDDELDSEEDRPPVVWVNIPDWWSIEVLSWDEAVRLPEQIVEQEPVDFRGILWGKPLASGIASRVLAVSRSELPDTAPNDRTQYDDATMALDDMEVANNASPPSSDRENDQSSVDRDRWHDLTIRVHADWLMTPLPELSARIPREFLHLHRSWVEREIGYRQHKWSLELRSPLPLDRRTWLYRHGPMGREEVVLYFDLCREMIAFAWAQRFENESIDAQELSNRIWQSIRSWLEQAVIDGRMMCPKDIIEMERRLIPRTTDSEHELIDCDCPLCRMQADGSFGPGPCFVGFDGYHLDLDEEFAFSLCETYEEWQEEQQEYQLMCAAIDAKEQQASEANTNISDLESVWANDGVDPELIDSGDSGFIMALGFRIAELLDAMRVHGASQFEIDSINNDFDAFRLAVRTELNLEQAIEEFKQSIEYLVPVFPPLVTKCADLQAELDRWMYRHRQGH